MIQIGQHIEFLLMEHDCVVVPGLGAFLIHYTPAYFDADTETFMPPSRTLGFNPEVNINDGLLADSVMRRHRLTRRVSMDEIAAEVSAMRHQLEDSGEVAVGRLGILVRGTAGSTPVFEPLVANVIMSRFNGLPVVDAPRIDCKPTTYNSSDVASVNQPSDVIPRIIRVITSVAAAVFLGIVLSTTTLVHDPEVSQASLDSGLSQSGDYLSAVYNGVEYAENSVERELFIAMPRDMESSDLQDTASVLETVANEDPVCATELRHDITDSYIVVVASFGSPSQAKRFISESGDTSLDYVEMDGNYRIYAATARSISAGRGAVDAVVSRYPSAWLCLKVE